MKCFKVFARYLRRIVSKFLGLKTYGYGTKNDMIGKL